ALELAESLLKRAQGLDPKPGSASLLARIYELRGMSGTSEADKKAMARARHEQLVQAAAGLSADKPANSYQLLTLARASLDAGDLERAKTLATQLLALVPKLGADRQSNSIAETIVHHGHLILGRIALRNDDI